VLLASEFEKVLMAKAAKYSIYHVFKKRGSLISDNFACVPQRETEMPALPGDSFSESDQPASNASHCALLRLCRTVLMKIDMEGKIEAAFNRSIYVRTIETILTVLAAF
jgi:hypothetical protein